MPKATNTRTGVTVTADDAVIRRLGPEWETKATATKAPARRRKPAKK